MRNVKRLAKLSLTALALGLGAVAANADQSALLLEAVVDGTCTTDANFQSATHRLPNIINAAGNAQVVTLPINLGLVSCSAGSTLSLKSSNGGLKRLGNDPTDMTGLTTEIEYEATATLDAGTVNLSTDTHGTNVQSTSYDNAFASQPLDIEITTVVDAAKQLVEGKYYDTLVVRIGSPI